jgi:Tol biopolymer transport system component
LVIGDGNARFDVFVRDRQDSLTFRVSISDTELQANDASMNGKISGNGLVVAFESVATNLVIGDTNDESDLFVRNITAATTTRVSVAENGGQSNTSLNGTNASISQDGNLVVFQSEDALVAGDITNFSSDVYLRNVSAGTTTRVSIGPSGEEADGFSNFPDISADGTLVVFSSRSMTFGSNPTPHTRIFLKNLTTGTIEHVSVSSGETAGFGNSDGPRISADGRFVTFSSLAPDLVSGDNNGVDDLFVRDRTLV